MTDDIASGWPEGGVQACIDVLSQFETEPHGDLRLNAARAVGMVLTAMDAWEDKAAVKVAERVSVEPGTNIPLDDVLREDGLCGCAEADRTYAEVETHHLAEIERLQAQVVSAAKVAMHYQGMAGQLYKAWWSARIGRARLRLLLAEKEAEVGDKSEVGHAAAEAWREEARRYTENAEYWRERATSAEAELGARTTTVAHLKNALADLAGERDRFKDTLTRVRAEHPRDASNPAGPWCPTCMTVWPCPTLDALDQPVEGSGPSSGSPGNGRDQSPSLIQGASDQRCSTPQPPASLDQGAEGTADA